MRVCNVATVLILVENLLDGTLNFDFLRFKLVFLLLKLGIDKASPAKEAILGELRTRRRVAWPFGHSARHRPFLLLWKQRNPPPNLITAPYATQKLGAQFEHSPIAFLPFGVNAIVRLIFKMPTVRRGDISLRRELYLSAKRIEIAVQPDSHAGEYTECSREEELVAMLRVVAVVGIRHR